MTQLEEDKPRCTQELRNSSTASKPVVYIPPRLDQEYYQAEVSEVSAIAIPTYEATRG